MTINSDEVLQQTQQILTHLVEVIGARAAGSAAEKQALDWLEWQFREASLHTTRFPVIYQPDALFFPYYTLAAAGFLYVGLTLPASGWISLLLPVLVFILPEGVLWLQKKLLPFREGSSNLLVLPEITALNQADLILCAHIDSARSVPAGPGFWKKWRDDILYTCMRMAFLMIILGLLQAFNSDIPEIILLFGQIIAYGMAGLLVLQDIWEQTGSWNRFTPGANDNASGAAVLSATAIALAKHPPANLKVGFLFTGAEECGLHGARQFAHYMNEMHAKAPVISVDMVGAGNGLRIITSSGTISPVKTSPEVNELLKRADPLAIFHAAPRRWGDFVPFAQVGIPTGHIENVGTPLSWATYHTAGDTLDVIDPEMLQHVSEILAQLIWILDKNKPNPVE